MMGEWWRALDESPLMRDIFPSWQGLAEFGASMGPIETLLHLDEFLSRYSGVAVHPNACIDAGAKIVNSIIGDGVEVYEGVTIRDSVVLAGATIGHGSEVARSVVMEGSFIPRFNYVGGSLLGKGVNLGGCVALATRRHDNANVALSWGEDFVDTGRWKFGSLVGEGSTLAFSTHVNPGVVIGRNCFISPYVDVRGFVPSDHIVNMKQRLLTVERRSLPNVSRI